MADSILDKRYIVTMADGSRWAVPVKVIAESRAAYYAEVDGVDITVALWEDTVPLFESEEGEIQDWAANNMDWVDVAPHAKCLAPAGNDADLQDGWMNGEFQIA